MRRRELRLQDLSIFVVTIGLMVGGCADQPEPVGRLGTNAGEILLSYPGVAEVELNWEMRGELEGLEGSPTVFLHLLDSNQDILRTFDHELPGPWEPGKEKSYSVTIHQSALAPPLDDGTYSLTAGLYDRSGHRWPLESAGPELADFEYEVVKIVVREAASQIPQFFFSSAWLGVEGGTDLQILGRRWLTGDGVIRLGGLSEAGSLRVTLGIPEGGGPLEAPVLEEGAVEQTVSVTTSCGDAAVEVSGPGSHTLVLPVALPDADAEAADCEVRFSANYYLQSSEGDERRTLALEGLSWSGAAAPGSG